MLKFIEKNTVVSNLMMKHIITMLKYGKMSKNNIWAESNGTKDMVTEYYNSLSLDDKELLVNIFSKIGFGFKREYDIIKFKNSSLSIYTLLTDQEKEILDILFGRYERSDIFMRDSFHIRCDKLLKKIVTRNISNINILDFVEERV